MRAPSQPISPQRFAQRLGRVLSQGVLQRALVGGALSPSLAHVGIFVGFVIFLPRTLVLFGRAFDPGFGSAGCAGSCLLMGGWGPAFQAGYAWLKDAMALVVLLGTGMFACLRLARYRGRLEPKVSALLILAAIATMMLADLSYDGAGIALSRKPVGSCLGASQGICSQATAFLQPFVATATTGGPVALGPLGATGALAFAPLSDATVLSLGLASYWLHLGLVGVFLVALPHTKHFHLITAWPKLWFADPEGSTKPTTLAADPEALLERVAQQLECVEPRSSSVSPIGRGSLEAFSVWERLDLFACTQCGRCSEQCPTARTGKALDPRRLNRQLRTQLERTPLFGERAVRHLAAPLVPQVVPAEALWACTQCGACEAACPVGIRYVGPILEMRRHQFMMRGAAPSQLGRVFQALERRHNPYGSPAEDRARWAEGLDVRLLKDVEHVQYLYWVGCAASYDERAQVVARALVSLMQRANVSFAILGTEERCTGDVARRTGNELLYLQLANHNVQLLNRYQREGRFERIIATCPHCLTTLGQQYPDLGGRYQLVSHVEAIEQWLEQGRLSLPSPLERRVTYHDPCTLARHAGVTAAPRQVLAAIAGLQLTEASHHGKQTSCCGAGGGQAWLPETGEPIHQRRASELRATGAQSIVSACPFCLSMLGDGARGIDDAELPDVCDVAELIELATRSHGRGAS